MGKYKNIMKGAFGHMLLAKDKYEEFATKMINKKLIQKAPTWRGATREKECISFKRHYIMRLIDFSKDQKYM